MTKEEVKLVTFATVALLAGALTKHYRAKNPQPVLSTPIPQQQSAYPFSRR